jgi:3-methyladenine DNA glycosylase AlkD
VTARAISRRLRELSDRGRVPLLQRFFRTAPGEYGEGDVFMGVTVPAVRAVAREFRGTPLGEIETLLGSRMHEERLTALVMLVHAFQRGDERTRRAIYDLYLAQTSRINNWDLVDVSAPHIVGAWLETRSRAPLRRLAKSSSLWERRIAIVATQHFIRRSDLADTFALADILLADREDLIHKAVGWMLREAGKRDVSALRAFLDARHQRMPRTMLRYAIERLPESERLGYLRSKASKSAGASARSSSPRKSISPRKPKP